MTLEDYKILIVGFLAGLFTATCIFLLLLIFMVNNDMLNCANYQIYIKGL